MLRRLSDTVKNSTTAFYGLLPATAMVLASLQPGCEGNARTGEVRQVESAGPAIEITEARERSSQRPRGGEVAATAAIEDDSNRMRRASFERAGPDSIRLGMARNLLFDPDYLVRRYWSGDAVLIRQLLQERIALRDTAAIPLLLGLFEAAEGEERIDFEVQLLYYGERAQAGLVSFLSSDDVTLVMRAVDGLAKLQATATEDSIALLMNHPDSWVRIGAAHALGEIAGPNSTDYLLQAMEDTAYSVVNASMVGLGRLKAERAVPHILQLIKSENPHVRKHAAIALGEIGDPRGRQSVSDLADSDQDPGVRFMAARALKKLREPGD